MAGHSLGEYSAHVCAGNVQLLRMRSAPCAIAASTCRKRSRWALERWRRSWGWSLRKVAAVCEEAAQGEVCSPANINSPEQIVISGNTAAVERAAKLADERGAKRAKLLAGQRTLPLFADEAGAGSPGRRSEATSRCKSRCIPVACNVDAELVTDDSRAFETLVRQVTGSVKWEQCMRLLIAQGVETFIEVGPGKVLCGLMRQIDRSKTCMNVADEAPGEDGGSAGETERRARKSCVQ